MVADRLHGLCTTTTTMMMMMMVVEKAGTGRKDGLRTSGIVTMALEEGNNNNMMGGMILPLLC